VGYLVIGGLVGTGVGSLDGGLVGNGVGFSVGVLLGSSVRLNVGHNEGEEDGTSESHGTSPFPKCIVWSKSDWIKA
jgi:hypothetical protein